ncbi:MAG: hypothetical protein K2Z81_10835 [Cyanobacteria bacterium]|nr:hypothetical protein [Cyanobacteriota bacterium]
MRRYAPIILSVFFLIALFGFFTSAQVVCSLLKKARTTDAPEDLTSAAKEGRPIAWWIRKAFMGESTDPDIVILGSSQLGGLRAADAAEAGKQLDYTRDFRGYCLERQLERTNDKEWRVFVAAIPGALVSDYCAMAMALFRKPAVKTLVIALAPRDFMPNGMRCPGDSPTFRYFLPAAGFDAKVVDLAFPHVLNRVSLLMDWYQDKKGSLVKNGSLTNIKPGQYVFQPSDGQLYQEMSGQYPINVTTIENDEWFKNQLAIMEDVIPRISECGTRIVIINMPLREKLRKQLSEQTWTRFSNRLRQLCTRSNGTYLDLSHDQSFSRADFLDNLHLSSRGGTRLAEHFARAIVEQEVRN